MKDEKLDELLCASLQPAKAPQELNKRLLSNLEKKRHSRIVIFKTARNISSCAAMFLCALTVLANFNAETRDIAYGIPVIGNLARSITFRNSTDEKPVSEKKDATQHTDGAANAPLHDNTQNAPAQSHEMPDENAPNAKAAENGQRSQFSRHTPGEMPQRAMPSGQNRPNTPSVAPRTEQEAPAQSRSEKAPLQQRSNEDLSPSTEVEVEAAAPQSEAEVFSAPMQQESAKMENGGKMRTRERSVPQSISDIPLSSLFSEDYDYKNSIYAIIYYQMTSDHDKGYNTNAFTEITGDEQHRITSDNELIIIFPAGQLAPTEKGVCEFNVGTLSGGRLSD